ncbi:putative ribonuclease H-like domain-containing protein [Tanacetum coccineum]
MSRSTSQTPKSNASDEKDEDVELIVVPSAVQIPEGIVDSRTSSTKSKKEKILTNLQQEEKVSSTDSLEDNPKIQAFRRELEEIALKHLGKVPENNTTSTPSVNTGSQTVNTGRLDHDDSLMPELEIFHKPEGIFDEASYDEEGVITDFNSLPTEIEVSPTPTLRIHSIHPKSQILGDPKSAVQTRSKVQNKSGAHALLSHTQKQQRNNHKDQQHCLFACFLSQEEPKKIAEALQDDSWVQAMQEELLQFKLQQVWVLVDLPHGMKVIGTKWVYRNKRDERGVVVRIRQECGPRVHTGKEDEEVYVSQPPGFVDPDHPTKILKKFDLVNVKATITPMETKVPLTKDEEAIDVDVHLYRSMIVTPKTSISMLSRESQVSQGQTKLGLMHSMDVQMKGKCDKQRKNKTPNLAVTLTKKIFGNMKRGFRGAPRPLLPAMLLVATTNPHAGQEHHAVTPSHPSSSTLPVPTTSSPPVQSPPPTHTPTPIPTPTPTPTPTHIPETEPEPFEHTFEEPSPVHQHFSPPQEQAHGQMTMDDLL